MSKLVENNHKMNEQEIFLFVSSLLFISLSLSLSLSIYIYIYMYVYVYIYIYIYIYLKYWTTIKNDYSNPKPVKIAKNATYNALYQIINLGRETASRTRHLCML